jgi:short-subunit dehydrogenase
MKESVLITGASRGLGYELACIFSDHNHELVTNCTHNDSKLLFSGVSVYGNLNNERTIKDLIFEAERKDIGILINNAAQYLNEDFENTSIQDFERIMGVNFYAPFKLIKGCWPIFKKKKRGLIININSLAGINGAQNEIIYSSSKHALKGFSESLKFDATKHNIRIIDIFLGAMNTDMAERKPEKEKLIDPTEVAVFIYNLCNENYSSLQINKIHLTRRKY